MTIAKTNWLEAAQIARPASAFAADAAAMLSGNGRALGGRTVR
jgi:hypothetical protein